MKGEAMPGAAISISMPLAQLLRSNMPIASAEFSWTMSRRKLSFEVWQPAGEDKLLENPTYLFYFLDEMKPDEMPALDKMRKMMDER